MAGCHVPVFLKDQSQSLSMKKITNPHRRCSQLQKFSWLVVVEVEAEVAGKKPLRQLGRMSVLLQLVEEEVVDMVEGQTENTKMNKWVSKQTLNIFSIEQFSENKLFHLNWKNEIESLNNR